MKNIFALILISLLCTLNRGYSQDVVTQSGEDVDSHHIFAGLSASYDFPVFLHEYSDVDKLKGGSLAFIVGGCFSERSAGFGMQSGFGFAYAIDKGDELLNYSFQMLDIVVPLSLFYKIDVAKNVALKPAIGLNFRIGVISKYKTTDCSISLYDENDLDLYFDSHDAMFKRFNTGYTLGLDLDFPNIMLGAHHTRDFGNLMKGVDGTKYGLTSIRLAFKW